MSTHPFGSLGLGLGTIPLLTRAKTRSISAENPRGEKGGGARATTDGISWSCAKDLGPGWKCNPAVWIKAGMQFTMAEIEGPGIIQHIWLTTDPMNWRKLVLRFYWDDEPTPSIEVPLGDFFCMGWNQKSNVVSLPICVNPSSGLNSYWPMPFRKSARMTVENTTNDELGALYYQIDYSLEPVPADAGYLHAQFRRSNPVRYKDVHTILDGLRGHGHYAGVYLAWQANSNGWWGEGEVKFYMDGDTDYPTICGTGTEDYFGGAWNFEQPAGTYQTFTTPFMGFHQHVSGDGQTKAGRRFGMYRWHIMDPVRFEENLRVTIQALGWREPREKRGRYLALQDDLASTAFWYQAEPHAPFPPFPDADTLEII
jgi:hypothetical protein